ncbi:MAG: hypothetical protein JO354_10790 [Verrucomicrobia bacterium]|nr:hypothetical protein [Verrucomicrobiota bacterium]
MIAVACGMAFAGAQAAQITGLLNISGTATFNTNSLATATAVTNFSDVTVGGGNTGSFSGIPIGSAVAMTSPYIFTPSTSTPSLWSVGGFTFDLLTSTVTMQTNNFLSIKGTGIISGNNYDPTRGVWAFTTQSASGKGGTFTFSANTGAAGVADGGMTVALLGAGLIGLALFRMKFARG